MKLKKKPIIFEYEIPDDISLTKLAHLLGVTKQIVWNWKNNRRIPAQYVPIIENIPKKMVKR